MFAPQGIQGWSVTNMILAITGIALLAIKAVNFLIVKKRENNEEYDLSKEDNSRRFKIAWLIAASIMTITSALLFILIQDTTRLMVMLDWWTIPHAILLALEIIALLMVTKNDKNKEQPIPA